jgi:sulfopropanediol 3-dehydrogenase
MHLNPADRALLGGTVTTVREPDRPDVPAQADPEVSRTVSTMLSDIEREGLSAVRRYAERLDGWTGGDDFEVTADQVATLTADLPADLRSALDAGAERTRRFAEMQRARLTDFEEEVIPGVVCGQKYIPVNQVGAYLPAGRFPLLASAFMTVGVARAAGVPNVVSCTPPSRQGQPHPAVLYAARASGAARIFAVGGVQALAAMTFGLLDGQPADMIVGAGNAYVAEAKRQLYGKVGIDVLAGPSEVAVIADETASASMVAADLLAQAEHGPTSPACLVTTSAELAAEVEVEIERQLKGLATRDIAGAAWRDWGSIYVADSPKTAAEVMDLLAPEHLEILTADPDFYLEHLHNYGSLFLGTWSTVAYADKGMSGTNHVLPTGRAARYTGGLSVTGYLKQLTYQRATRAATQAQAELVVTIADFEEMPGHRDSAQLRLDLLDNTEGAGALGIRR